MKKRRKKTSLIKRNNRKDPDPWKELRLKLQPLGKAYSNFMEKRKIAKQKEEQRRLKEQEEQKIREAARKLFHTTFRNRIRAK